MLIALDYDKTFTADRQLWREFVSLAEGRGHSVVIATMRRPDEAIEDAPCRVVYTSRAAKKAALSQVGINPDIWIDDTPAWILFDA